MLTEGVELYLFLNFLFCYYFRIHQRRRPVKGVPSSQKKCRMRVTSKSVNFRYFFQANTVRFMATPPPSPIRTHTFGHLIDIFWNAMHLICTCNATYTVKEAVSTLYSHVYTVHAHYMYAVNTSIAQLKTYSEIPSLQDYH